jgi:hypothetical protein
MELQNGNLTIFCDSQLQSEKMSPDSDSGNRVESTRKVKLQLPRGSVQGRVGTHVDYDESECVSDTSYASESCTSGYMRGRKSPRKASLREVTSPTQDLESPSAHPQLDDPIVRTGSALLSEQLDLSNETDPESFNPTIPPTDLSRERIAELEKRLEAAQSGERRKDDQIEAQELRLSNLHVQMAEKDRLISEYERENAELLLRLHESRNNRIEGVSCGIGVAPETNSKSTETASACAACSELRSQLDRYRSSAEEATRLGEALSTLTDERDKLRADLKRAKPSDERIKLILKENDNLKEALRKRFPSNYTSLMTCKQPDDSHVQDLETKLEQVEAQWSRRLEALRVKSDHMKSEYEKTLSNLLNERKLTIAPDTLSSQGVLKQENRVLSTRVKELESRVESLKNFHYMRHKRVLRPPLTVNQTGSMIINPNSLHHRLDAIACPPLPEREVSLDEWVLLLRRIASTNSLHVLTDEFGHSDYRQNGLVDRSVFQRVLAETIDRDQINILIDIYAFGDEQVDYKAFLSDVGTRSNIFLVDLESQNRKLRSHVDSLMKELKERIESVENSQIIESLQHANHQLAKREDELKVYKTELNRFLTHNVRNVSLGE